MSSNPVRDLQRFGQSVWLDFIRRNLMTGGELDGLIENDGLRGMTSNPAIFEKAIAGGDEYKDGLRAAAARHGRDAKAIYEELAIADIQAAADRLAGVFVATAGRDGFVSLEVAPDLADDTEGTIAEARRLWARVARPNLMIKVPGTAAGIPAIRALLEDGIHVNITLLFSRTMYRAVAEHYLEALETRVTRGEEIGGLASVASFFVSRIDTAVDALLGQRLAAGGEHERITSLLGRAAIANAKLAYQDYLGIVGGERWRRLAARGARPQRLLWASTSTKNPAYRDVLYVEELVGADTVNTVPPETLAAFRDHGVARASLIEDVEGAKADLNRLAAAGISLDQVTDQLLVDGVKKFVEPFAKLLATIDRRARELAA